MQFGFFFMLSPFLFCDKLMYERNARLPSVVWSLHEAEDLFLSCQQQREFCPVVHLTSET
jgi:hypothetical protein